MPHLRPNAPFDAVKTGQGAAEAPKALQNTNFQPEPHLKTAERVYNMRADARHGPRCPMASANFNTSNQTFRQLMGNGLSYRVPPFQRGCFQGCDGWENLWQDIDEVKNES